MNIAICVDDNYFQQACAVIRSLIKYNSLPMEIYFLGLSLSTHNIGQLSNFENEKLTINYIETCNQNFNHFKLRSHVSHAAYVRLELPVLLPDKQKILYLDADLIINADLAEVWNTSLHGKPMAAVENPFFNRHVALKMSKDSRYFNSGVIIIDLDYFRKHFICEKAYKFVNDYECNMVFHDQDALNHAIDGNWIPLNKAFNFQTFFLRKYHKFSQKEKNEIKEALKKPVIIHYSSGIKPWDHLDPHPLRNRFLVFYTGDITVPSGMREKIRTLIRYVYTKSYYFWFLHII